MKQKVITLLLGVCMIATLVVGCGNSKNKESEKENVNESEVVTEVESEIETEIESEIIETEEVETETTESQNTEVKDTETKVEDTTSSEQKENKPSSDKGQSGSGSANNKPQNNTKPDNQSNSNSNSSDVTWTNGNGDVLSNNPALCSHVGGKCMGELVWTEGNITVRYDSGAYERELIGTREVSCTWCGHVYGTETEKRSQYCIDEVTDFVAEFRHLGDINTTGGWALVERLDKLKLPDFNYFEVDNIDEIGAELVKYAAGKVDSVNFSLNINTTDYEIVKSLARDSKENAGITIDRIWELTCSTRYKDLCKIEYTGGGEVYIFANLP
ncbi:MAG: hypothetical protein IJ455_06240 [Agathobacter sp.]|nr:hypothetical protein [Agathobacter sp.]